MESQIWAELTEPLSSPRVDGSSREEQLEVLDRLNEVIGPGNWSEHYSLLSSSPWLIRCRLELYSAAREGFGRGQDLNQTIVEAFLAAAARFSVGGGHPSSTQPAAAGTTDEKPEVHQLVDRLIERLRQAGQGREAAKLVTRLGGYGHNSEETKRLYTELRDLFLNTHD